MTLDVFPYQAEGADWLARRERAGLLDLPGVGKTAQAVRALDLRRARRVVIVCPAHLRENWLGEFAKFARSGLRVVKGRTVHDFVAWSRGVFDVLVVSYETAVLWRQRFDDHAEVLDVVVIDEFHYCNSLAAARTRAVIGPDGDGVGGIAGWAVQAWALTGTLMTNDPANCYSFLRFCRALEMPFATFVRRYFTTRASTWGQRNRVRPAVVDELRALLANNSVSRSLADVGHQLPPIFLTTHLVEGDTQAIRDLLAAHPGLDGAILTAVREGGLSFLDSQHVATMRRLVAEAKAVPYAHLLASELREDSDRKVVVMGNSVNALATVHEAVEKAGFWCVQVRGGISEAARVEAVRAFQDNPACRVFVGNMTAAGTGLTLTAAARVDVLESDWTPAKNDQAIKRVRRLGQTREQHARFITLANSIDVVVNRAVAEKTAAIAALGGEAMIASPEAA